MKRPWHIWFLFLLCLAVVLPAMGWLTLTALELDRAETLARRQAELEEDVSRALWRMDARLMPLLAQEAARPHFVYRPFYPANGRQEAMPERRQVASPLLVQPSEYVLLYFQLDADNQLSSPQCPTDELRPRAIEQGIAEQHMQAALQRLSELQSCLEHEHLLAQLPAQNLPAVERDERPGTHSLAATSPGEAQLVANALDYEPVQQQLEQQAGQEPFEPPGKGGRSRRSPARQSQDLQSRNTAYQSFAQQKLIEQRLQLPSAPPPELVTEGISQPLWIGNQLLLARRVDIGEQVVVQGCWLDWAHLQGLLLEEVAELLPQAGLEPVTDRTSIKLSRLLATLPVQLTVPASAAEPAALSPIRLSLLIAWGCLLLAAIAVASLLQGVLTLSERRAAFVSAVTHELRTPLTTFRMYAEMLSEGMVPDAGQRQQYLQTLQLEADRLYHLVENVLQYARLERGRAGQRREQLSMGQLLERLETRLSQRAQQAHMQLEIELDARTAQVVLWTDPSAVDQILFNLVDNACKYAAAARDRRIHLQCTAGERHVELGVRDHGPGISAAQNRQLFRPFSKSVQEAACTAPGVGLGLALCRRLARALGGRLEVESDPHGAKLRLLLPRDP